MADVGAEMAVLSEDSSEVPIVVVGSGEEGDDQMWEDDLIEEVKSYPVLWDKTRRDYGHNEKTPVIWALIGKSLGREPSECMEKWKNLRDSYVRRLKCVRRVAYHGLTPRKPNWRYFEAMSFLDAHVNHRINQVDNLNEDPIPNYSSRDVVYYDDGKPRAPNKNSLGGMGKTGPAAVHVSALPKQPVALFSRIGLGEISVINDQNEAKVIGSLLDQMSAEDATNNTDLTSTEVTEVDDPYNNVMHVIIEGDSVQAVTSQPEQTSTTSEFEEHGSELETVTSVNNIVKNVDTVSVSVTSNVDTDQPSHVEESTSCSQSSDIRDSDVSGRRLLRPGRKRSYRHLQDGTGMSDDVTTSSQTNKTAKRTVSQNLHNLPDISMNQIVEEIRTGFSRIESRLDSMGNLPRDSLDFGKMVAAALSQLPNQLRCDTKLRIEAVLHEASEMMRGQSGRSQGSMTDETTVVAVQDGDTYVLCDSTQLQIHDTHTSHVK